MDWQTIKKNGYKDINGQRLDLSHLQDAKYPVTIAASGKFPQIHFTLLVQYSSHCISWGPSKNKKCDKI